MARLTLHNAIRIDGGIFMAREDRIVWSYNLPNWAITVYCTIAEMIDPSDAKGGR